MPQGVTLHRHPSLGVVGLNRGGIAPGTHHPGEQPGTSLGIVLETGDVAPQIGERSEQIPVVAQEIAPGGAFAIGRELTDVIRQRRILRVVGQPQDSSQAVGNLGKTPPTVVGEGQGVAAPVRDAFQHAAYGTEGVDPPLHGVQNMKFPRHGDGQMFRRTAALKACLAKKFQRFGVNDNLLRLVRPSDVLRRFDGRDDRFNHLRLQLSRN